jgi:hypothetical protein
VASNPMALPTRTSTVISTIVATRRSSRIGTLEQRTRAPGCSRRTALYNEEVSRLAVRSGSLTVQRSTSCPVADSSRACFPPSS